MRRGGGGLEKAPLFSFLLFFSCFFFMEKPKKQPKISPPTVIFLNGRERGRERERDRKHEWMIIEYRGWEVVVETKWSSPSSEVSEANVPLFPYTLHYFHVPFIPTPHFLFFFFGFLIFFHIQLSHMGPPATTPFLFFIFHPILMFLFSLNQKI